MVVVEQNIQYWLVGEGEANLLDPLSGPDIIRCSAELDCGK